MGTEYWNPLLEWIHEYQLKNKYINPEDLELFSITDDVEKATNIVSDFHKGKKFTPNF